MSLNSILNIATSGLMTSQSGLRTVSQNIANVNTPGYARIEQSQQTRVANAQNTGVEVAAVRRAADRFFQAAGLSATAGAAQADAEARYYDRLQAAFGDPSSDTSLFASVNRALGSFEMAVIDPGSMASRRDAIAAIDQFLAQASAAGEEIQAARVGIQDELRNSVDEVNSLLRQISTLNGEVVRNRLSGDGTGAEQRRSDMIDQLSEFMDIRVIERESGAIDIRTSSGVLIASEQPATISIEESPAGPPVFGRLAVTYGEGATRELEPDLRSGSLRGLINLRDQELGGVAQALGDFTGRFADAVNAIHNANTTLPPIASMTGRNTGLLATDALNFTGTTEIAVVNTDGTLARRITVDFDGGAISVDGAPAGAPGATIGSMAAALNTALGGFGNATFANGQLTINATNAGQGIAFGEPETGGSQRGDKAFAHFFGMNNLIESGRPTSYATGLAATDAHGFAPGDTLSMRLLDANGAVLLDRDMTIPGGSINDLMNVMNDNTAGLGLYGAFTLTPDGTLGWAPDAGNQSLRLELTGDVGPRGGTGLSFGQLTGLSQAAREERSTGLRIDPQTRADPARLGFAQLQLDGATVTGDLVVGMTDSRGAQALSDLTTERFTFTPALGAAPVTMKLADYLSGLAGDVGSRAASAQTELENAQAIKSEAVTRRANIEGVNLDEELVKLTQYQQAYNAAARMVTVADEMFDTLLRAV